MVIRNAPRLTGVKFFITKDRSKIKQLTDNKIYPIYKYDGIFYYIKTLVLCNLLKGGETKFE